ncbi:MAG: glycosyltransferase [Bacteroidales bacterium]|jgi:glycosyltransferase involved in cell wall biosynthesis|nr:glycosyltransferase [Bacteroidales bacterium]
MLRILILAPAYPYRGGLASFTEMLARSFTARGEDVQIATFTLQYPQLLFPGKTQFSESPPPDGLRIIRLLNSVNPFNWIRTGIRIRRMQPDMLIVRYWTPFLSPSLGMVCRLARKNRHTTVLANVDNVVPHEQHFYDALLTRYFVRSVDGFLYMSQQVKDDLDRFTSRPAVFAPHPLFSNFGERVTREEACLRLHLDPNHQYLLFFGLIRPYKGLDLMLDAWAMWRQQGGTAGRKLIVAGEFYTDPSKYLDRMERLGIREDIILHDRFIKDNEVKYYFSLADMLVQPYKSATQSGVTQIAYHFETPMIVTRVGGLAEIVTDDKAGYVVPPDARQLSEAMEKAFTGNNLKRFAENMKTEKQRFSWEYFAEQMMELYEKTKSVAAKTTVSVPPRL